MARATKPDGLRNFTVRFLESALRRVEASAKPYYGGRLSTGEAIRRLAEERLNEIESKEGVEQHRDALLRVLRDWRSARRLPAKDIRLIAEGANAAYQHCRSDFVSRDLLIANLNAFLDAVKLSAATRSRKAEQLQNRYYLENPATTTGKSEPRSLIEAIDACIALLPDMVSASQAELVSRNLSAFLRDENCPDEAQLGNALRPHLDSLLELAIRAHWYVGRRPLLAPGDDVPSTRPTRLRPLREGSVSIEPLVLGHDLTLSLELHGKQTGVSANNFAEIEDLRNVTRIALAGYDVRGDVFGWSRQPRESKCLVLTTECATWTLEAGDANSIGQALELLFRDPSVSRLAERLRFVYGRI